MNIDPSKLREVVERGMAAGMKECARLNMRTKFGPEEKWVLTELMYRELEKEFGDA